METAEPWHGNDLAACNGILFCLATDRRSLRQRKMSSIFVLVTDVLAHQTFQMSLIHDDHMVEQIATTVSGPALGNAVLPRTSEAGSFWLYAETFHGADNFFIELRGSIKDEVAGCRVVGKCFPELLNHSLAGRVLGHVAMNDTSPVMRNDEEAVENTEGERWHGEEVHCRNGFAVVAQIGSPPLCRLGSLRRFPHPTQHRSLRNLESEHFQFTVNLWCTPCGVLGNHAKDEFAEFFADAFSSSVYAITREPRPIQLEPSFVPTDNRLWLNEDQSFFPSRPKSLQDNPEQLA
jgi:hypothetical protein